MPSTAPTPWAHLRAILICLAVGFHMIDGLPIPRRVRPAELERPESIAEIQRWQQTLSGLGIEATEAEIAQWAMDVTHGAADITDAILKPVKPILKYTKTGQGWGLFAVPAWYGHRLTISMKQGPDWQVVYARNRMEPELLGDLLRYRRLRAIYDGASYSKRLPSSYRRMAHWLGPGLFEQHPEAPAMRVSLHRTKVVLPGEPADPTVVERRKVTVKRHVE